MDVFSDYRPCRPTDYVGREELQKDIWDFLILINQNKTTNRLICITGASGLGKSSTIVKLSKRFKNVKWKNKFYLYPIDVRSAKGPLYIAKSIKLAIEIVAKDNFLPDEFTCIQIGNTKSIFESPDLIKLRDYLRENEKVFLIFFKQFEELFTKEELFPAFEIFRKTCLEIDSIQENIVLGFSWRTGISFNNDHPAYFLWHELQDKRKDFRIIVLSKRESSSFVTKFEKSVINRKLERITRRRILEQSEGFPWLLKKLLVHLKKQIDNGKPLNELITGKFDVKPLFDQDLEKLNKQQISCLKYKSPIDISSVSEIYPIEIINFLYSDRLVIRTGQRYSVYWDIFRDYLKDDIIPNIPLTYLPKTSVTAVKIPIDTFQNHGIMEVDTYVTYSGYTQKSGMNTLSDCLMFSLIEKNNESQYLLSDGITSDNFNKFLQSQLKHHVIYKSLREDFIGKTFQRIDEISKAGNPQPRF